MRKEGRKNGSTDDGNNPPPKQFHCFWTGQWRPLLYLSLCSLIRTQLNPWVCFWTLPCHLEEYSRRLRSLPVIIRQFRPPAADVPFATPTQQSDFVRHEILLRHGGIYFDLDILFLKPISLPGDWAYEWSFERYANTALLQLQRGGETASKLVDRGLRIKSFLPTCLYQFDALEQEDIRIAVHPCEWFDPVWKCHDRNGIANDYCNRFDDFFERGTTLDRFFPDAHCYHWHNRWDRSILPNSTVGRFWEEHVASMLDVRLSSE